jgi:hypothetical protein
MCAFRFARCLILLCGLPLFATTACLADLLYRTDFEAFAAGDDRWVGTEEWIGTNPNQGVHGIDQDVIEGGGLGKTAFLGFRQPATLLTTVAKPVNHSPGATGLPLVRVETLIGIQDSVAKVARDSFFVSVYNSDGYRLAGIRFDNRQNSYGIWRMDGTTNPNVDTGVIFYRGELHVLTFTVDLPNNTWSADLWNPAPAGGDADNFVPLFHNAPFTATTRPVNFGLLAYEWEIGAASASGYGDNWMLIADTEIRSVPAGIEPFRLTSFARQGNTTTLSWPGQRGFDYQVEYSDDLGIWHSDLPDSTFAAIAADQTLTCQDLTPGVAKRWYRVRRTESP